MTVITQLDRRLDDGSPPEIIDELRLTSEERASAHFSALTVAGRRIRVSLPRGVELHDGDVLMRDGATAVVVRAADEDLLWLSPRNDPIAWSAACYQLGNLHRPARFLEGGGVLTPRDPMALQMLRSLDVAIEETRRPFVGQRFGAAGAHHAHDHRHEGHDHHHDDGHHHHHGPDGAASRG